MTIYKRFFLLSAAIFFFLFLSRTVYAQGCDPDFEKSCAGGCIGATDICCGRGYCTLGNQCASTSGGAVCIPTGTSICGNGYCWSSTSCATTSSGRSICIPTGTSVCGEGYCTSGYTCQSTSSGSVCIEPGRQQCGDNWFCNVGYTCAVPNQQCCQAGTTWNGSVCACPAGTGWNGSSCVSNPCPLPGYPQHTQYCSNVDRCFIPPVDCNSSIGQCNGTLYGCFSGSVLSCTSPPTCVYTPAPTVDLKADNYNGPNTIIHNASATLSWVTSNNPTSCTASGSWSGAKAASGGSQSIGPLTGPQNYIYTLTCTNAGGNGSDSVTINVTAPPRCPPPSRPDQTKYCASQDSCTLPTNDCSSVASCGGVWQFCPSNSVVNCGPPVTCVTAYCGSGLTRATGLVSAPVFGSGSNFGTTGACIIDPKTAFAPFKIPTYDDLKSLYYDQKSTSTTVTKHDSLTEDRTQSDIPLTGSTAHIYHIGGNLTIANNIPGNESGVIFVDGDLTIAPSSNRLTHGTANTGLILVVGGNVAIHKDVTQVDAVIIAKGTLCTAYDGTACPATNTQTQQLVINGSLISINQEGPAPIKFRRTLTDNRQPAEKINHQVKYLVILRDLISDTLQKWSEIP